MAINRLPYDRLSIANVLGNESLPARAKIASRDCKQFLPQEAEYASAPLLFPVDGWSCLENVHLGKDKYA